MSRTVDARVVEMTFDNSQFESGVKTSMKTLEKLKTKLQLEDAHDGLTKVSKTIKEVTFNNLSNSVSQVISKLSVLDHVIWNLKDKLANMTINFATSLTVDPVKSGWAKYEEELQSLKTIMAATGKSQEEVMEALSLLTWFADETSYSYTDMVSAVSKFTSSGIELSNAVTASMGIANWAARSGVNATSASSAYYNLAQAMGKGALTSEDWRSIMNLNMNTQEFKNLAIEVAKLRGTLDQNGRVSGHKNEIVVTSDNFEDTLQYDWFSKDVMMDLFTVYGMFAQLTNAYVESADGSITAAQGIEALTSLLTGGAKAAAENSQATTSLAENQTDAAEAANDLAANQSDVNAAVSASTGSAADGAAAASELAAENQKAADAAENLTKNQSAAAGAAKAFSHVLLEKYLGKDAADKWEQFADSGIDLLFSKDAFIAAQETRTFSDAVASAQD
ncbi:MAG: tape measure protein, partial [Oscillospiraceae bacterium]|nr:tape measure protein [Oscillospiraceae bacterium]